MRVLLVTQFFSPEIGATQTRMHAFAAGLAKRGHEVEVVCEVPNHPQGIVHPGFGGLRTKRTRVDGFDVTHVWVKTSPEKTTAARLAFYASFAGLGSIAAARAARPDVIFATSPPLPGAVPAAVAARRHRVPWVMDVRDLWPDAAVALGELANPRALRFAERLERRLYESADAITAVTAPFVETIASRTSDPGKVHLLPNGTSEFWLETTAVEKDRAAIGLRDDEFLWVFAGNIGAAQGLEAAIEAAAQLGDGHRLLILGDGPARAGLEGLAAATPQGTVEFRGQVQPEEARRYLRAADALLVPLAPDPILSTFVPSKLYDCCATGVPVVLAAAGEPQRLAAAADATLPVPPGDPGELANAVRRLAGDGSLRASLGVRGREFARANLREDRIDDLERLLEDLR